MSKTPILTLRNLEKTYDSGTVALRGIDLTIAHGDFFALLGPNGAGKSTTIGIISGLVNKTSGEVIVAGKSLDEYGAITRRDIGVVPQEFNFGIFEKVYDIVISQAGYYGIPRHIAALNVEKYLKALGLWEKRDSRARALSGGMKRRLMIARGLVHNPKILILDEPTAGVDIELRRGMYDFLRELNNSGTTIILTTHYLEEAETLCNNMAIIDKGEIIREGPIKKLLASMEDEVVTVEVIHPPEKGDKSEAKGGLASDFRHTDLTKNPDGGSQKLGSFIPQDDETKILKELSGYNPILSEASLDLTISSHHTLDDAIKILQNGGYRIRSIKPKSGRLEEFFVKSTLK